MTRAGTSARPATGGPAGRVGAPGAAPAAAGAVGPAAGGVRVAVVHDYLTQRGGAERVVLAMVAAFPDCRLVTSVYDPDGTFPELRARQVDTLRMRAAPLLRRDHRLGLALYGPAFRRTTVTGADVVLCSSSGFAHLVGTDAPKVVYCYNPPRWLYQADDYVDRRSPLRRAALAVLGSRLRRADLAGAQAATAYLAVSGVVAKRIQRTYGIRATVVHPPYGLDPDGPATAVAGVPERALLLVARGRGYKHAGLAAAAAERARRPLVVVGGAAGEVERSRWVVPLGRVAEAELRWLYRHCDGVLGLAHEDFGLTPVEGHAAGTPTLALRHGGYVETVAEGTNGAFVDRLDVHDVARAMARFDPADYDPAAIAAGARRFSPAAFATRLAAAMADATGLAVRRAVAAGAGVAGAGESPVGATAAATVGVDS